MKEFEGINHEIAYAQQEMDKIVKE